MKFVKGVPKPGQHPFWRIYFHAVDDEGMSVQFFDDVNQVAHWVYVEGADVCRLENLATEERMELPDGWWTLLERYLVAGHHERGPLAPPWPGGRQDRLCVGPRTIAEGNSPDAESSAFSERAKPRSLTLVTGLHVPCADLIVAPGAFARAGCARGSAARSQEFRSIPTLQQSAALPQKFDRLQAYVPYLQHGPRAPGPPAESWSPFV